MTNVFKVIGYSLLAVLVVILLAVVLLVTWVNPNDYREDISRIAHDKAGVELTLGGDLSWRFYPVLGFGARDVALSLQPGQAPLLKVGEATVGVKIMPLLSKKIEIDALDIGGMRASLLVNERGENNWQLPPQLTQGTAQPATPSTPASSPQPEASQALPALSIPVVRIHDSRVHYQDKSAHLDYTVDIPRLELHNVSLGKPFPLLLEAQLRDANKLDVSTHLQAQVNADLQDSRFALTGLKLAAKVGGLFAKPIEVNVAGNVHFDQKAGRAEAKLSSLEFANLKAKAELRASGLSGEPTFSGQLETQSFDARQLASTLDVELPATSDKEAFRHAQLATHFSGTPQHLDLKPLSVKLDSSTLAGEVAVIDVAKQAVRFDLRLDKLDADRYLPPESARPGQAPPAVAAPAAAQAELIPVKLLRGLNIKGTFHAGEVTVSKIPLRDIGLGVEAIDGNVHISNLGAKLLAGTLAGDLSLDARPAQPRMASNIKLSGIDLGQLLQPFTTSKLLSGRADLNLNATTSGNDMKVLMKQALGQANVVMPKLVVHGVNVNQVALSAVKEKLGDFTLLYPDYRSKLPSALKRDTDARNLKANMKLERGHLIMPNFNVDTGEGTLGASGDIDMLNKSFDYRFQVMLSALNNNKYLKGTRWPVNCKGNLDTPPADMCRPDSKAVKKVLERAAKQALDEKKKEQERRARQKAKDALKDKLDKLLGR